jgi:hypothetical protein
MFQEGDIIKNNKYSGSFLIVSRFRNSAMIIRNIQQIDSDFIYVDNTNGFTLDKTYYRGIKLKKIIDKIK